MRGCRERVEGGRIRPGRDRDTVIGPVAFYYLPESYGTASIPDPGLEPPKGFRAQPIKAVLLVRAGARVTLVVPRAQRSWMRLLYVQPLRRGTWVATLHACHRGETARAHRRECGWSPRTACRFRNTQFNGGIYVDFDRAPQRGRCAELIVEARGATRPLRRRLFTSDATCRHGAR